jgi:hypothetical protein
MGMRVRVGPVSVSSRGRVGVNAGPVSVYGGGRRRRTSSSGTWSGLIGLAIVLGLIVIAVMWPLSLFGHAIGLTPSWHELMHHDHVWEHQHYPLIGLRYLGSAAALLCCMALLGYALHVAGRGRVQERRRLSAEVAAKREQHAQAAHAAWLASPPPPLELPGRFTQNWVVQTVPQLHPGQVRVLLEEMRRRGWSEADITRRVRPYLPIPNGD